MNSAGSTGHKVQVPLREDEDEEGLSHNERLVEEGIAEAEIEQSFQATRAAEKKTFMNMPATTPLRPDNLAELSDQRISATPGISDTLPLVLFELITQQPFFKGLTMHHLRLLADSALGMNFEPEQTIFAEGSPANRFYLIVEGKVVLESETGERGVMIPIQTLGPGEDLGWSCFFPPYSFQFSARAVEPTKTLCFYGPPLRERCEQDHELGYQIMKRIAEVATQSLGITQRRLMRYIDKNIPQRP